MKKCSSCQIEKSKEDYYKDKNRADGLYQYCKVCHKVLVKKNSKNYYQNNKEKIKEYQVKYRIKNRDNINEYLKKYNKTYQKEKRTSNPIFKMKQNLRSRTTRAFKVSYWHKNKGTEKLLGATYEVVFNHIESRFAKGMTWENQGEWHIDHIIPLSSASTEEELIQLCHYTNLQPLWASDNISKGDKIIASRIEI